MFVVKGDARETWETWALGVSVRGKAGHSFATWIFRHTSRFDTPEAELIPRESRPKGPILQSRNAQNVLLGPAAPTPPGNLLEMKILKPPSDPTEPETAF